jgi:dipeptidyl-peptidase-4
MKTVSSLLALVILSHAVSGCAGPRLSRETADQRYKFISENFNKLVTGGRVTRIRWSEDGSSVSYSRGEKRFRFDLTSRIEREVADAAEPSRSGRGERGPARGRQRDRVTSPDKKWVAVCRDWNVIIEPMPQDDAVSNAASDDAEHEAKEPESTTPAEIEAPQSIQVTTDGHRKFRYGSASWVYGEELDQTDAMWWSPDSAKLVFYEFDEQQVPDHYITGDLLKLHTKLLTEGYPKPGEPNPIANLLIYDLNSKATIRVRFPTDEEGEWYTYGVQFSPDETNSELLYFRTNRHQNVLHLVATDPATGDSRVILTEQQETWQDNSPAFQFLDDGSRFIWTTEKTGWKQFELRDLYGAPPLSLTSGAYPVSSIVYVNEDADLLYYTAFSDANPLNLQLHRVRLDGTRQERITRQSMNHTLANGAQSPDGKWFIVERQSHDIPPATVLLDADGNHVALLDQADASLFHKLNMSMPELFTFKADDGVTDLYGVVYKPSNFDPRRKYPLLIDVYGGPHSQAVRNRYTPGRAECEYGLLIAQIDNRGTVNRGKAFESATYLRLGDVDLKDQADGVRFLSQRSYVDASRVGIMGHSYGGYMSALALLKHPDVFHVAVAGGTVTDWRNYDTIYTERYMRTPQENTQGYDDGSCLTHVKNLKGKLLLVHGMLDDNVHTNNAWQLIDALQKADLPFEMMLYPEAGHSIGARANRVRWDFLRRHLLN